MNSHSHSIRKPMAYRTIPIIEIKDHSPQLPRPESHFSSEDEVQEINCQTNTYHNKQFLKKRRQKKVHSPLPPLYNPDADLESNKTDNLNHLRKGLNYNDPRKLVKILYSGQVRFDRDKLLDLHLMTFENDFDFLESTPKIDFLVPCESLSSFFEPIIENYTLHKNDLVQLRREERVTKSRRQYLGFVEGLDQPNQQFANQIGMALLRERKSIRIAYGIYYANISFFHIKQIYNEFEKVPVQSIQGKDQCLEQSNLIFIVNTESKLIEDLPRLICRRRIELL